MRRIPAILCALVLLSLPGCQTVANAVRDMIFGGIAEAGDTSRPPNERHDAYQRYMEENVDR